MVSDVDVGVFLSGGIDSSLITSVLQRNSSKKIQTFTIGSL
jgi:asparagine synthase (glutamine-hydrolysing)